MNVIFISPNFPTYYYNFTTALRNQGVTVLGIGDATYDELRNETKESLVEYYRVNSLESYEEVRRAVAFFTWKYGRIDYIESQNEYWLETEANLRKDFNIKNGTKASELKSMKFKSKMKDVYQKAGIKTARYLVVKDEKSLRSFIRKVKYPVVIKPDNGVGALDTYKLSKKKDVDKFLATHNLKDNYIVEEFVPGRVETFDGITDSKKNILICSNHVMLQSIMDTVNEESDMQFYNHPVSDDIKEIGTRAVKAFETKKKFFHFEFFRLLEDKEGLGNKGEIIGLEVNMRAPGAYIPDMINYAYDNNIYDLYAQMLVHDKIETNLTQKYCVGYAGRRDSIEYIHQDQQIKMKYKDCIVEYNEVPESLAAAMGNHVYLVKSESEEKLKEILEFILAK